MSASGLSPGGRARLHDIMAGHIEQGELPGLVTIVSRRGETHGDAIGSQAVDGVTPMARDTIFRITSMTKPVTAVAAMILVEECRLRLDDPVDQFLPDCPTVGCCGGRMPNSMTWSGPSGRSRFGTFSPSEWDQEW